MFYFKWNKVPFKIPVPQPKKNKPKTAKQRNKTNHKQTTKKSVYFGAFLFNSLNPLASYKAVLS